MKRSAKALTFAAVAAAGLTISGCWGFGGNVYGPPPEDRPTKTSAEQTESRQTEASLPPTYDPSGEPEVDVYGPPPDSPD